MWKKMPVCEHDADEAGLRADGAENVIGIYEAAGLGRDECGLNANTGHAIGGLEDGGVFDGGSYEVVAGMEQAEDGGVVAFGAAGIEDYLGVVTVEEARHGLAGAVNGSAGPLARLVDGGGIAKVLDPIRAHGLHHLGQQGCGGIRVHIDSGHGRALLSSKSIH